MRRVVAVALAALMLLTAMTACARKSDEQLIREHFGAYFRHYDHDYSDLKKLLGVEPLVVTILPVGTLKKYEARYGRTIRKINPSMQDVVDLKYLLDEDTRRGGGRW